MRFGKCMGDLENLNEIEVIILDQVNFLIIIGVLQHKVMKQPMGTFLSDPIVQDSLWKRPVNCYLTR